MTTNEGLIDRGLRIFVGLCLIGAALGYFGGAYQTPWGWIGVIPLVTGLIGWCPAYHLLGIDTHKHTHA